LRPPPKGSPGALGMRRCIAVHLSLDKAARPGTIAGADPFQCDTIRPIDGKACRRCPRPPMWPASLTAAGSGDLSPGRRSALVTLRYRPWSLIARGIRRYARDLVCEQGRPSATQSWPICACPLRAANARSCQEECEGRRILMPLGHVPCLQLKDRKSHNPVICPLSVGRCKSSLTPEAP
jgi:hypothetical protein